jgi:hypothetical protein
MIIKMLKKIKDSIIGSQHQNMLEQAERIRSDTERAIAEMSASLDGLDDTWLETLMKRPDAFDCIPPDDRENE